MENNFFYKIIDGEIIDLMKKYNSLLDEKNLKDPLQRKSFTFYIWFLNNCGLQLDEIMQSVTDGSGDNGADLIFSLKNTEQREEYYVLQSKWNKENNCNSNMDSETINGILTEFEEIKRGKVNSNGNGIFQKKYGELLTHKNYNNKTNYIILSLNNIQLSQKDQKRFDDFNANVKFNELLIYDINKLKLDYIDKYYKGYKTANPLIYPKKPLEDIEISVLPLNDDGEFRFLKLPSPHKSYLFCVKPSEIYDLFCKYEYTIFQDNIRNPLMNSKINKTILGTLKTDPSNFWYYNNGVTGITKMVYDFDGDYQYSKFKIKGLQIINGGQTFKTIYDYYDSLNPTDREILNNNVKILFKIIESPNEDFDLNITRFTNSQNAVDLRDFYSNEIQQKRIQKDFMINTNVWYEVRRGEFIKGKPREIRIIENTLFAQSYIAYWLGFPEKAKQELDNIFISKKDGGLYEDIFNENTKYIDLFIAYSTYTFIQEKEKEYRKKYNKIIKKGKVLNEKYGEYFEAGIIIPEIEEDIELIRPSREEIEFLKKEFIMHSSYHILMIYRKFFIDQGFEFSKKISIDDYWYANNSTQIDKIYNTIIEKMIPYILKKEATPGFALTKYFKGSNSARELGELFGENKE